MLAFPLLCSVTGIGELVFPTLSLPKFTAFGLTVTPLAHREYAARPYCA